MPPPLLTRFLAALLAVSCLACDEPPRRPLAPEPSLSTFRGTVVGIADGDTITILDADHVEQRVRLAAIDAPERGQPFGRSAKESLAEITLGRVADVEWQTRDRYGRMVGKVMLPDPDCPGRDCPNSFDAGLAQLSRGNAWWYRRYAGEQSPADRRAYEAAERTAKSQLLGVWSEPAPIPPWDWREEQPAR
ncbi:MAG: thermonuclease family protein [Thermoanaerobaculia bacterium]|jgi:endonuclease YncB( thermonuclease family)